MNVYEKEKVKYADIFNQRGLDYHKAMLKLPNSRDNEFLNIASQVSYKKGMKILDIPSGGNYLKAFLPDFVDVIPLETSSVFADLGDTQLCEWSYLPFENNSIDIIFCCAAFHHVSKADRVKFRNEAIRVLKKGGKLVIADVAKDSNIDTFLNGFVNEKNSMGHQGDFLTANFSSSFSTDVFQILSDKVIDFPWILSSSIEQSMQYMQLLFGLDNANTSEIEKYLKQHLNLSKTTTNKYQIDWQLRYVTFINS